MNRARNTDHASRTCERFVYLIVKISDNQDFMIIKHGRHICLRNSRGAQRYVGFFPLDCAFQVLIGGSGHLAKLARLAWLVERW